MKCNTLKVYPYIPAISGSLGNQQFSAVRQKFQPLFFRILSLRPILAYRYTGCSNDRDLDFYGPVEFHRAKDNDQARVSHMSHVHSNNGRKSTLVRPSHIGRNASFAYTSECYAMISPCCASSHRRSIVCLRSSTTSLSGRNQKRRTTSKHVLANLITLAIIFQRNREPSTHALGRRDGASIPPCGMFWVRRSEQ